MFTQFQNYVQKNVGTTSATLITCPAGRQLVVNQLSCANITALPVTVSVSITRAGIEAYIVLNATVNPGGSLGCAGIDQKIVLMAGDQVKVQSNTASSIDAVASGVLNDFNSSAAIPNVPTSPVATFTITPNTTTIYEGATVTYTVATTNVPNGTILYWDNFGTTDNYDFTDGMNYGPVVITSNAGSFTRTLVSTDVVGERSETIVMGLRFGAPPLGGVMAVASTVVVRDSIITSGLIMNLDAGNPASYPGSGTTWTDLSGNGNNVTLQNSPTFDNGVITFNGTNQWARTAAALNLTTYNSITVEMLVRSTNPTVSQMAWEHTANWNTNVGGLGLSIHSNGTGVLLNVHHTNHNASVARNYEATVGTDWALHTNIYSRIGDSLGRLTYVNGTLVAFSVINGYATTTVTPAGASFANDVLYFASRGGTSAYMPGQIARFRIYNRKLSATEISQNYQATVLPPGLIISPTISSAVASAVTFTTGAELTNAEDIEFSTDGTKMYLLNRTTTAVLQYNLGTAWNVSTAVYSSKSFSMTTQLGTGRQAAFIFNTDGTALYAIDITGKTIYQYTLGTAWDISTASYASKSFSVATATSFPVGLAASTDGRSFYTCDPISDQVDRYLLGTAWDISTATLTGRTSYVTTANAGAPQGVDFYDSNSMYVTDQGNVVYQYRLTTPWDVTTAVFVGSKSGWLGSDTVFSADGTKAFPIGGSNVVTQWNTTLG